MRRVGLLGTLVWDRYVPPGGRTPVERWGGLAYSLAAFAAACPPGWEGVPLIQIGYDLWDEALSFLRRLPNLRLGPGLRRPLVPNNRVALRYTGPAERVERLTGGVPPWSFDALAPLLGPLDALYVNFIAGWELDLPTLEAVRGVFRGPVYGDLHSLLLGCAEDGTRVPRTMDQPERWVACFDVVQANTHEWARLGFAEDPLQAARRAVTYGPRLALVTRGADGAWVVERGGATYEVPAPTPPPAPDPTGCGDVWGSTFFCAWLAGVPPRQAAAWAHAAAGAKLAHAGADDLVPVLRRALSPYLEAL